jgi:hypothetical protein
MIDARTTKEIANPTPIRMTVCAFTFRTEDRSSQKCADDPTSVMKDYIRSFSLEAVKYCRLDSGHAGMTAIAIGGR